METIFALFLVIVAAAFGGTVAKLLKFPTLVGYIVAGIVFGAVFPVSTSGIQNLSEIGIILLLFSIGIELSFDSLSRFFKISVFGALIQIISVVGVSYLLIHSFGLPSLSALILSVGFSLSSTAVVVKILADRGELGTLHGGIMLGWLLVQDLAVVPIMVVLPSLAMGGGVVIAILLSLAKAIGVVAVALLLGRIVFPYLIHKVAELNLREVLLLSSVALALGTAAGASLVGISPALGAFLAGFVISESQEHHAIFAETRPLRDLFVALFFVSLGFLVSPGFIFSKLPLILAISVSILIIKAVVVFIVSTLFDYKGRTAVTVSLGLSQVGEFAFVIFSQALILNLLSPEYTSLGIAVTLLTLIVSPLLFKASLPVWRALRNIFSKNPSLVKIFAAGERQSKGEDAWQDHIIICGYGRVGRWVGKALAQLDIPFVVIEYNQKIVQELKEGGVSVLYGDPTEPEVLEAAQVSKAKAIVLAIPDPILQETLITHVQTIAPGVRIISRAHQDSEWEKLKTLRVNKIVQPEFEGAVEIVRSILGHRGKTKLEVVEAIRGLRVSHSK